MKRTYQPNKRKKAKKHGFFARIKGKVLNKRRAKKRGCHSVHVDTMSWQAPEFYKKHGYELISELDNIPNGYKKFHFIKRLDV